MKPSRAPFDAVREIGLALPGVKESISYRRPALKVGGQLLARLDDDGETLMVRLDRDARNALLRAEPRVFFITEQYRNHPTILVRLGAIKPAALRELLEASCRSLSGKRTARPRR